MTNPGIKPGDVVTILTKISRKQVSVVVGAIDQPNERCFTTANGDWVAYSRIVGTEDQP